MRDIRHTAIPIHGHFSSHIGDNAKMIEKRERFTLSSIRQTINSKLKASNKKKKRDTKKTKPISLLIETIAIKMLFRGRFIEKQCRYSDYISQRIPGSQIRSSTNTTPFNSRTLEIHRLHPRSTRLVSRAHVLFKIVLNHVYCIWLSST